jgi:hypothetical protein
MSLSIHDLFMLTSIGTRGNRVEVKTRKVDNFFAVLKSRAADSEIINCGDWKKLV